MAQTKEGARKAAETMRKRYGEDYWRKVADKSNAKEHRPKGFAKDHELARKAGELGRTVRDAGKE